MPRALFARVPAGFPLVVSTYSIFPLPVNFGVPFILRPPPQVPCSLYFL